MALTGFTRATMQRIADKVTTSDDPTLNGLVNVNTAPPEVLATVPGMTRSLVQTLMEYRQSGKVFQTIGDLFALNDIGRQQYQQMLPYLTASSSTYIVRIKVRVEGQLSVYAVSALVEMTEKGPVVLQWREVPRMPGWAYWMPAPRLPMPGSAQPQEASEEPIQ